MDQAEAAYKPVGVAPGKTFDTAKVAKIDGALFREGAGEVVKQALAGQTDPVIMWLNIFRWVSPAWGANAFFTSGSPATAGAEPSSAALKAAASASAR
jgi:hypothetical protein